MELKKNENRDLRKFRTLFRNVGLVITLVLTITAFEWKWEEVKIIITENDIIEDFVPFTVNTTQELPKAPEPPKPESKVILTPPTVEIIDTEPVDEKKEDDFTPSDDELTNLFASATKPEPKIDTKIYDDFQVEKRAEPTGSFEMWYGKVAKYCEINLRERDRMFKGKVWLSFVVENDGSISDIEIIQSVHKRIDALAIKAVKSSGEWSPAKMGARPVRQRMRVPISFK